MMVITHRPLQLNPSCLRNAYTHVGESWEIPNMDSEPDKSKWLAKGNPEEMPHISDLNCHRLCHLSPPVCVSTYAILLFPPDKHFTCFITFCFCGNSFLQSQRARALSNGQDVVLLLLWPHLNLLQATVSCIHARSVPLPFSQSSLSPVAMYVMVCAQSCPTLCNPLDCSLPGSSVHGILPARIQVNFPTQGSTLHLLHWQTDSLPLCHLGRPPLWVLLNNFFPYRHPEYFIWPYIYFNQLRIFVRNHCSIEVFRDANSINKVINRKTYLLHFK